jgi:TonB family protein
MGFAAEQGYLSREDAEEAVQRRWSELVGCYHRAGAARNFLGGTVKLRFLVDAGGRAATVHVLESSLGSVDVEHCLVAVGQTVVFPRPEGGGRTPVEYSLEFRASGEIAVVDLPDSDLARPLRAWLPRFATECQELGASEVMATLYIEPRGAVRSVGIASSTPLADDRAACLLRALQRWTMRIEGHGGLWRVKVALRAEEIMNLPRPELTTSPDRRLNQGRRNSGRR